MGHPYSLKKAARLFWAKVDKSGKCWIWKGRCNGGGYGETSGAERRIFGTSRVSRIAYQLAKGKLPKRFIVRHTCDNPPCCRPSHLIKGTHKQNMADARRRNRLHAVSGNKHHATKIRRSVVPSVVRLYTSHRFTQQ